MDGERCRDLEKPIEEARSIGVEVEIFERDELEQRLPDLVTEFGEEETELMGLRPRAPMFV